MFDCSILLFKQCHFFLVKELVSNYTGEDFELRQMFGSAVIMM